MYDRSMMESTASNGHYRSGSYGASTDGAYGYGGYGNNPAMYGQNYSYPTTTQGGNNYGMPQYPPQHLVDAPSVVPGHSSPPVASAQPEYPIHRSPPASPTARHSYQQMMMHQQQQQMQMQMQYQQQQPSYSQQAPPQPLSSSSTGHSRPSSQDYTRSTTSGTMHRRNHSSAKMINTIERPKYAIPTAIDTSQTGTDGDEVPFVAVSPISSDDEDDDYPPFVTQQQQQHPPPPPPHPYPSTTFTSESQEKDVLQQEQHQPPPPPPRFSLAQPEDEHVEQQEHLKPTHNRYSSLSLEANADYSILTELSTAFKNRMKRITNVREVKSSNEYPESFSGQEAIVSDLDWDDNNGHVTHSIHVVFIARDFV